jgi:hypothetical protein
MMLMIFCLYAYGFYFGGYLRWNGVLNRGDTIYSSGVIIAIVFSIIFGAFQLGSAIPHVKGIKEGQVACKLAQDTMKAQVAVDPHKEGKLLDRE